MGSKLHKKIHKQILEGNIFSCVVEFYDKKTNKCRSREDHKLYNQISLFEGLYYSIIISSGCCFWLLLLLYLYILWLIVQAHSHDKNERNFYNDKKEAFLNSK